MVGRAVEGSGAPCQFHRQHECHRGCSGVVCMHSLATTPWRWSLDPGSGFLQLKLPSQSQANRQGLTIDFTEGVSHWRRIVRMRSQKVRYAHPSLPAAAWCNSCEQPLNKPSPSRDILGINPFGTAQVARPKASKFSQKFSSSDHPQQQEAVRASPKLASLNRCEYLAQQPCFAMPDQHRLDRP
jgi:hypothetical protein